MIPTGSSPVVRRAVVLKSTFEVKMMIAGVMVTPEREDQQYQQSNDTCDS